MEVVYYLWYVIVFGWLFVMGCAVGSFLNVVIYRLPRGKNLGWPSSRCGSCYTPIPIYHNIPLVSYWRLRGRCATCRASFSMRYFWVELLTGCVFVALYTLEIGLNVHGYPLWPRGGFAYLDSATFPPHSWQLFIGHAVLASLLIAAAGCLLEHGELPPGLVGTGALLGLAWSLLYPWPEPMPPGQHPPHVGFVFWPVWEPLPDALAPRSLALGLVTGLAGLLLVPWLVRLVDAGQARFLGRRVLGPTAGLSLMTGGFLGWQPLLVALGVVAFWVLLLGVIARWMRRPVRNLFALGVIASLAWVWLGWSALGPLLRPWLFDPVAAPLITTAIAAALFALGLVLPAHPLAGKRSP